MNHDAKLTKRAQPLGLLRGLLMVAALSAVALVGPHTPAVAGHTFGAPSAAAAARTAPLRVRKIVCRAQTISLRRSPGGQPFSELRRGEIFIVTNKHDNVWFYGHREGGARGGWVLAQYLCDLQ